MLKINIRTQTLQPMLAWLKTAKEQNFRSEFRLREILSMEDYGIEFARYGSEGLPVCGISFEEAVDFFLNFDCKDFDNPRLQVKKESFNKFYGSAEGSLWTGKKVAIIATHGYEGAYATDPFEMGIQRLCKHSNLEYVGLFAVQDKDNLASFQTAEAVEGAKKFARRVME